MKVVQINSVYKKGSTGNIAYQIQQLSLAHGIDNVVAYSYTTGKKEEDHTYCISSWFDCHLHNRLSKYTQNRGSYSRLHTYKFIRYLKKERPDIVHIHNIHDTFINVPMLFSFLKSARIKTVWTLHDCWPFTGNCPYYDMAKCDRWVTGCKGCKQYLSVISKEQSAKNWERKKSLYADMDNLVLVTPSSWLSMEVQKSFLYKHPAVIISNGIDLDIFKPTKSDFKVKYGLENKYVILGVAFGWGKRKGLDVFVELAKRLDITYYQIVLVGTDDDIDSCLPKSILSIHRTNNQKELAAIYTSADLFVNPTREEMFGLVNIEALACGTPGVTFRTGGSPECYDDTCGAVVECDDIDALEGEIVRICRDKPFEKDKCVNRAQKYNMNDRFQEYIDLYRSIYTQKTIKASEKNDGESRV